MADPTRFLTTIRVEAMVWDGSLESVQAICDWARGKLRDDQAEQDPPVSYLTQDGVEAFDVLVETDDGSATLRPLDWVVHVASDCFKVVTPDEIRTHYASAAS